MYNENFCIRRIKELMKKNDDTLYRLSKRSGVSLSTLASMFEKNTDPRVETIEKICAACDMICSPYGRQWKYPKIYHMRSIFLCLGNSIVRS